MPRYKYRHPPWCSNYAGVLHYLKVPEALGGKAFGIDLERDLALLRLSD